MHVYLLGFSPTILTPHLDLSSPACLSCSMKFGTLLWNLPDIVPNLLPLAVRLSTPQPCKSPNIAGVMNLASSMYMIKGLMFSKLCMEDAKHAASRISLGVMKYILSSARI